MDNLVVNGVRLTMTGAESLPLAVVRRGNPAYDAKSTFFTLTLKNESGAPKKLPYDELSRGVVLIYRNPATGAEQVDNRTPPPKRNGAVEQLAPGATRTFQVVFEYPQEIATLQDHVAVVQFCVKWEAGWLRASTYRAGSYNWNDSFELCRELRLTEEQ